MYLQEWLSPQGKFALVHQTDEILINEAVTVEPKPQTKDPEDNQDVHVTAVTQLTFPQCQTSYVGLPGMQVAPQPMTTVHPAGDTPYTRLPGSVWVCGIGDVPVTPSPPQDVFESSCGDSGCSWDELSPSPECSSPNTPVEASSPPRYCKDYCILNKTAGGVVPVLVCKWFPAWGRELQNVKPDHSGWLFQERVRIRHLCIWPNYVVFALFVFYAQLYLLGIQQADNCELWHLVQGPRV